MGWREVAIFGDDLCYKLVIWAWGGGGVGVVMVVGDL